MTSHAPLLAGEIPQAAIFMALALVVAFLGSVGIGAYVLLHTPERFRSAHEVPESEEVSPRHAA